MSYDKNKPLSEIGEKVAKALIRRNRSDWDRKRVWERDGAIPYMEKRYPSTLLEQIACHNPSGEWFGYTFEPMTLRAINEDAFKCELLPRNLYLAFDDKFNFAQYIYLLLTTPNTFEYWSVYDNCPNIEPGWRAFKFEMNDLIMGHTGVLKIENCYRELGDVGAFMYDPTEKGKVMIDVGVTEQQLNSITTDLSKHLTLICSEIDNELYANKLFVGDPVRLGDISLPWSDERCNGRAVTLTQARSLGYEYVQLSKEGTWKSEIRKDPTF